MRIAVDSTIKLEAIKSIIYRACSLGLAPLRNVLPRANSAPAGQATGQAPDPCDPCAHLMRRVEYRGALTLRIVWTLLVSVCFAILLVFKYYRYGAHKLRRY